MSRDAILPLAPPPAWPSFSLCLGLGEGTPDKRWRLNSNCTKATKIGSTKDEEQANGGVFSVIIPPSIAQEETTCLALVCMLFASVRQSIPPLLFVQLAQSGCLQLFECCGAGMCWSQSRWMDVACKTTTSKRANNPLALPSRKASRYHITTFNSPPIPPTHHDHTEEMAAALRVAASRAARNVLARSGASPASVGMPVRCLSSAGGEYNPFTHSLDRLNTKKVGKREG